MKIFKRKKRPYSESCLPVLLNENEKLSLRKWFYSLPKRYKSEDICFRFEGGGGIGVGIIAMCGDKHCDITDVSVW